MRFTCDGCSFFKLERVGSQSGRCHRFPPNPQAGVFPRVMVDDWCGEHSALWPEYEQNNPDRPARFVRFLP